MIKANDFDVIIEPYFDGGDSYTGHKKFSHIMNYEKSENTELSQTWCSARISVIRGQTGRFKRNIIKDDISNFDTVTLKMICPKNVRVQLYFNDTEVLNTFGSGQLDLFEASLDMEYVDKVGYSVTASDAENAVVDLYYVGVSKRQKTDIPLYTGDWEGAIEDEISFEVYTDTEIDPLLLKKLPEMIKCEPYKTIYESGKEEAEKALLTDPEKYISKAISSAFRKPIYFNGAMITLAFVGMVEKNEKMIRMAIRYALSMAACTYWSSDIMEEVPSCVWHHRSFNESLACEAIAFVISVCGRSLTWHGRNILYQALIMKGLPRIEADFMTMDYIYKMNQGLAFMSGYVKALVCLCHEYPRYERRLEEAEGLLNEMLQSAKNSDGSTNEGPGYWEYTFWNALKCITPIAKKKKKQLFEYIGEDFKKTGDFGLFLLDESTKLVPINDMKKTYYLPYVCKCFYLITHDIRWVKAYYKTDAFRLGFADILLDAQMPAVNADNIKINKEFESFDDAGLVSVCRDGIRLICISGKSNSTHSHKDKGSFLLYYNEKMLLADRGSLEYDVAVGEHISGTVYHNAAAVIWDGNILSQRSGNGFEAKYHYEYKNGIFVWNSDQSDLWDDKIVKKNIRTIISDNPYEYIITDEFEFREKAAVAVSFQRTDTDSLEISTITDFESIEYNEDNICYGNKKIYMMTYRSKEGKYIIFKTKIKVKGEWL